MDPRRVVVCGVPVDCVDAQDAVGHALGLAARGRSAAIFAVNPEKAIQASRNPRLRHALDSAGLLLPDGIGVVLAARWLQRGRIGRVPGCELMPALCAEAAARGLSVFLFGAAPGVAAAAAAALQRLNPGLRIAGYEHGYVDHAGTERLIARINELRPDMLFVALGSPKQELWITEHLARLNVKICQGVGGTLDVLAGNVKRCPRAVRALQLEWLYRLLSQPRRAMRQSSLPIFAGWVARELIARRLPHRRGGTGAGTPSQTP